MEYKAVLKNYRGSARKARLVIDLIRGKEFTQAQKILFLSKQKVAKQISKLLKSVIANAKNLTDGVKEEDFYVLRVFADEGRTSKRFRPRAQGRATTIRKRYCHISVYIASSEKEGV